MNIWLISREYAGIAEAGGVKNVACSLCENLVDLGHDITLFIPEYGCTDLSKIKDFQRNFVPPQKIESAGITTNVYYHHGTLNGVKIVFVSHKSFLEKDGVYTYTVKEEKLNYRHRHGSGHEDSLFMDVLFQKAVVQFSRSCNHEQSPDIVHCQDATTALIPVLILNECSNNFDSKVFFSKTKCVVTIHNAGPGYHHEFPMLQTACDMTGLPQEILIKGMNGNVVEPFLLSTLNAVLTTVSPEYAEEIISGTIETAGLSQEFNKRNIKIIGITNGIDYNKYAPEDTSKSLLPYPYNPLVKNLSGKYKNRKVMLSLFSSETALVSTTMLKTDGIEQFGYISYGSASDPYEPVFINYHGRIVRQKGIDILVSAAEIILNTSLPVRFIFVGHGEPELENSLIELTKKYKGKCIFLRGYNRQLTRLTIAASDFISLPSNFEPCGLEDFIAQIFGTIPIAHATGGLKKIIDEQTGFLYQNNNKETLASMIQSLVILKDAEGDLFNNMIQYSAKYVKDNYSWRKVVKEKYLKLYSAIIKKQKKLHKLLI